jgi:adhesin transport system outer membrane protein
VSADVCAGPAAARLLIAAIALASQLVCAQSNLSADRQSRQGADMPPAHSEQVPALGESQIRFLDALRLSHRQAAAVPNDASFRERVREAVVRHPEFQAAIAASTGARGFTDESRAAMRPQIIGQSDGGWRSFDQNRLFGIPERRYSSAGLGVSIRQLVYDFGATEAAVQSAQAREKIADARSEARRAELALRAVQVEVEWTTARLQAELAAENRAARSAIAQYVRERFELGGGSVGDSLRAQARVADAQAGMIAAQTRVDSARAAYQEIFGREPPSVEPLGLPVDIAATGSVAELANQFASVRAAAAGRDAASSEAQSVRARALPQLNLEGSITRRDLIGDGAPGNDRTALLNLRYEFYNGGASSARDVQAVSRLEQAEQDFRSALLGFERFAAQVLSEWRASDTLVAARVESVELAASSLRAVREQFAFRRGTLLDLLNAQEVLQAAGRDLIEVYGQRVISAYRVLYIASRLDLHFQFAK